MKTPPFLLGAALVFWGWQTGFLIPGTIMGVILEGSRFVKLRWDLSDDDFKRIWTFCALLFLAAAVYAFADAGGPAGFSRLFDGPNFSSERDAGSASAQTAASLIRWVPMVFFLFVCAQAFSVNQEVPLHTISLILQRRWKRAKKMGMPPPEARGVDVGYPYFALTLFAASVHRNENNLFFWGLCALLGWALWMRRPKRFGTIVWMSALALTVVFGYGGARGIAVLQRYVESFNIQWVAQFLGRNQTDPFRSRTQIGQIGRIKTSTRIVIRLTPESGEPPSYLREASYRAYRSPVWFVGRSKDDFTGVNHIGTNENTYRLIDPDKTNTSRIGIACFLEGRERSGNARGLLPLPSGSSRLENLAAYVIQKNGAGDVMAEGPGLMQFDALYGPGATIDAPPETNKPAISTNSDRITGTNTAAMAAAGMEPEGFTWLSNRWGGAIDLYVPTNEIPALDKVIAELNLKGENRRQTLAAVGEFFATKFTYRMWQDVEQGQDKDVTPLEYFLLKSRAGHCEYFATATVLLLRRIGIPARYAVGYSVHEASLDGYVVRQRDAHAWCIVWNEQKQAWEDFDTTPGSWFDIESGHAPGTAWMSDAWWWVRFEFSKLRWGQTHMRDYILIGLVPVLGLLLFQIVRQRRRRGGGKGSGTEGFVVWPGLDSEFYNIEKQLAERGIVRGENEALTDWLERAATEPSLQELREPLRALLRLHYRYRFDPEGLGEADREELRREARECLEMLSRVEKAESA